MARVVTLFIRDTAINLLVMKGRRVDKWATMPLEPGLVSQGLILDEAQVADRLKELFKLEKVTAREVIAGLSGQNSIYRTITLPELPEAVVAEAVKHEARRVIPVSLDEVYLSYQPVPALKEETRLFLVAYPRNMADALLRTLRLAGVEPYLMDLVPLALSRIPDEPRAIIVNARLENLDITIMADRVPQVIRSLPLPSEAESLEEKLPTIAEELNRTVAFYNSSHLEKPLDSTVPVFVCGDLAEAPEIWQSLVGNLGYSVSPLPPPVEYPEGFPANEFMVNIGLALKELLPEKAEANFSIVNLNALPEVYQPKALRMGQILVPIGIAIGIGLLIYVGSLVRSSSSRNDVLRSELAVIEHQVTQHHKDIATLNKDIKQVEAQIEPAEATWGIFDTEFTSLKKGREQVNEDLNKICINLLPSEIDLTEVIDSSDSVTVTGIAPDEDYIFRYARLLKGRFSTVIISSIENRDATEEEEELGLIYDFELLLKGERHGYFYTTSSS